MFGSKLEKDNALNELCKITLAATHLLAHKCCLTNVFWDKPSLKGLLPYFLWINSLFMLGLKRMVCLKGINDE
jgi:hypothetical protein